MSSSCYHTKPSDSQSYASGYEIFLKRTNFREEVLIHFKQSLPTSLKGKKEIRVLDIGCGNGGMTKRYLETVTDVYGEVRLHVHLLEPSLEALGKAKNELSSVTSDIVEINQTADEYFKEEIKDSFDLIIASYVFYHIPAVIVPNIIRSLSPDGAMSIMMGSRVHPLRGHPDLRAISKHGDSDLLIEVLGEVLSRGAISTNLISIKTNLDLNGLWNDGVFSDDGKKFFAFIYNVEMNQLPQASSNALNIVLSDAYTHAAGVVHPNHEIIWVKKS